LFFSIPFNLGRCSFPFIFSLSFHSCTASLLSSEEFLILFLITHFMLLLSQLPEAGILRCQAIGNLARLCQFIWRSDCSFPFIANGFSNASGVFILCIDPDFR
jgi:hypothetical protein